MKLSLAARRDGDARRGAIVFHQPLLACTKCRFGGTSVWQCFTGRSLSRLKKTRLESLVESILEPSKAIRKGFEPVIVQLTDGRTVTGLFV